MYSLSKTAKKTLPACILLNFFIICLVCNPQRYIDSIYKGMLLFAYNVAPALLPFFFFTRLLTALGWSNIISRPTKKAIKSIYNCPPSSSYILIMSLISGYPVGAKLISDFYKNRIINTSQAKKISSFTSTSGPLFVVGTIGTLMFQNLKFGYLLFFCHALGSLLNGIIFRGNLNDTDNMQMPNTPLYSQDILGDSLMSSLSALAIVGGYIAIFSMIIDIMVDIKLIYLLSLPLEQILSIFGLPSHFAQGFVVGLFEITSGCKMLSQSGISFQLALPFLSILLSFGGISIAFQSLAFLGNCKIKVGYFILTKTTQAIITFMISLLACIIFY